MPNNANVTLYGTVTQEPTNKQTRSNQTWMSIRLSVQTTKENTDPQTKAKFPYQTDTYDVSVFGAQAEKLLGTVKAKTKLLVVGEMQMGEPWTDQKGNTHITPRVNANKVIVTSGGNWQNNGKSRCTDLQGR